jgi:hypothetical protein
MGIFSISVNGVRLWDLGFSGFFISIFWFFVYAAVVLFVG